jgi:hypothetical protein
VVRAPLLAVVCADGPRAAGQLDLLDGGTGRRWHDVAPGRQCRSPVFSPDGRWLALQLDGDVVVAPVAALIGEGGVRDPASPYVPFGPGMPSGVGLRTFQFDASGSWIAIATEGGVLVLPTGSGAGDGRRVPLPPGLAAEGLTWSERGTTLAVTARDADGVATSVWLDAARCQVIATVTGGAVLAVPDDDTLWMVGPHAEDGMVDGEAHVLRRGGQAQGGYVCTDGRFVFGWLPRHGELLLGSFAEDAGDEVELGAVKAAGGEVRILLQGVRGVHTISLAPDGAHAAFLCEDDPNGLHLVATTGSGPTRLEVRPAPNDDEDLRILTDVACGPSRKEGAA